MLGMDQYEMIRTAEGELLQIFHTFPFPRGGYFYIFEVDLPAAPAETAPERSAPGVEAPAARMTSPERASAAGCGCAVSRCLANCRRQ